MSLVSLQRRLSDTPRMTLISELARLDTSLRPAVEQYGAKKQLLDLVKKPLQMRVGGDLETFGSCENGFWTAGSDVDACLVVTGCSKRWEMQTKLKVAASVLTRIGCLNGKDNWNPQIQLVTGARVPVAKLTDLNNETVLDLSINNLAALENSALVSLWGKLDHRVRPLGRIIKHWASCRKINNRAQGTLSTYTLLLQVVYLLQTRKRPILPSFKDVLAIAEILDAPWDEKSGVVRTLPFRTDVDAIRGMFMQKNSETAGDLLHAFFQIFGAKELAGGGEFLDGARSPAPEGVLVMRCPLTRKNVNPMTRSVWLAIHSEFARAKSMLEAGSSIADICAVPQALKKLPPKPPSLR